MWRPEKWDNTTAAITSDLGKLRDPEFPIVVPNGLEWSLLKQKLIEAGADAMLRGLITWIRSQDELEMMDDPENFNYYCVRVKDLAELGK